MIKLVYNSIPDQHMYSPNQLTMQIWNNIINQLRTQTNLNTEYLQQLHKHLFGDSDFTATDTSVFSRVSYKDEDETITGQKEYTKRITFKDGFNVEGTDTIFNTSTTFNSDVTVNGKTDLENVLIKGESSFNNAVFFNDQVEMNNNLRVSGATSFVHSTSFGAVGSHMFYGDTHFIGSTRFNWRNVFGPDELQEGGSENLPATSFRNNIVTFEESTNVAVKGNISLDGESFVTKEPTDDNHIVNKGYVDNLRNDLSSYLPLSGGTIEGQLDIAYRDESGLKSLINMYADNEEGHIIVGGSGYVALYGNGDENGEHMGKGYYPCVHIENDMAQYTRLNYDSINVNDGENDVTLKFPTTSGTLAVVPDYEFFMKFPNEDSFIIKDKMTHVEGDVYIEQYGDVLWIVDDGTYEITNEWKKSSTHATLQFKLPKALSKKLSTVNGVYTTGTIAYEPALAYGPASSGASPTTFNCQSYVRRSAIGETKDTFEIRYSGLDYIIYDATNTIKNKIGFHLKMPLLLPKKRRN